MKATAGAGVLVILVLAAGCATESADRPLVPSAPVTSSSALTLPQARSTAAPGMPDRTLTPGSRFPGVGVEQVCASGYSRRARLVLPEQYRAVYGAYGLPYPQPAGTYELDHLIPLELGGDNSNSNLWPEPSTPLPGFHEKDELENALHDLVCSGHMALSAAQSGIASDWVGMYLQYRHP